MGVRAASRQDVVVRKYFDESLAGVDGDIANRGQVAQVRVDHVNAAQDLSNFSLPIGESSEHAQDWQ